MKLKDFQRNLVKIKRNVRKKIKPMSNKSRYIVQLSAEAVRGVTIVRVIPPFSAKKFTSHLGSVMPQSGALPTNYPDPDPEVHK